MSGLDQQVVFLADRRRMRSYAEAIRRTVRPGDHVIDLGCGTGILGFLALRAGAARVTAIERGPMIHLARRLARANGFDGRVRFVHADSREARGIPRADVIVSELMWNLGVGEGMLESLSDAGRRLLKRGGRMVPRRVSVRFEPVSCPHHHRRFYGIGKVGEFDFSGLGRVMDHHPGLLEPGVGAPLARARTLLDFDLARLSAPPYPVEGSARFRVAASGTVHGWAGWFEAELSAGVRLVSRSGTHWRRVLLPVAPPVRARRGQVLELEVRLTGEQEVHWSGKGFAHSSWLGEAHPAMEPSARPVLSRRTAERVRVLSMMDGRRTVGQIARALGGGRWEERVWRACLKDGVSLR